VAFWWNPAAQNVQALTFRQAWQLAVVQVEA